MKDLQHRGLLDSTVVYWGGEMGRLPVIQNERNIGRDHNTYGFSSWFAGGGFKGGYVHGATDELGHKAVEGVVTHARLPCHAPALIRTRFRHAQVPSTERRGLARRSPAIEDLPGRYLPDHDRRPRWPGVISGGRDTGEAGGRKDREKGDAAAYRP